MDSFLFWAQLTRFNCAVSALFILDLQPRDKAAMLDDNTI